MPVIQDPRSFSDTRVQLHWASQLLAAAADALLEKADDDSHSNLGWDAESGRLSGRAGCQIDVAGFALEKGPETCSMTGKTLKESIRWLSETLNAEVVLRDYEMPPHHVQSGGVFSPSADDLTAAVDWFTFARKVLTDQGDLRVWPHHFDMGFWSPAAEEGKSIGGGFSLGDHYVNQPYFYVNPYGIDKPESLPALKHGHWTDHWLGAVLTADELAGVEHAENVASGFVGEARLICEDLLSNS